MRTIQELLSDGGYVSGEEISAELGISRAAVWKRIRQLQEAGWPIVSGGKRGYRLDDNDRLDPPLWLPGLSARTIGRGEIRCEDTLDSTNAELKRMALAGAPHGSVCLCEEQTAGKGRLNRSWESVRGAGLWFSVLLRPALQPESAPLITLCAALSMTEAIRETTGVSVGIKWPNDLICEGKKLCGILLEMSAEPDRIEYVVVGIGLNTLPAAVPESLRGQAACLADFTVPPKRRVLLARCLEALERLMDAVEREGWAGIADAYRRQCVTLGRQVRVVGADSFIGTAEALDETGALLVRDTSGTLRRVLAGDVSVRGLMGYA